jgi:hypothetical protein
MICESMGDHEDVYNRNLIRITWIFSFSVEIVTLLFYYRVVHVNEWDIHNEQEKPIEEKERYQLM